MVLLRRRDQDLQSVVDDEGYPVDQVRARLEIWNTTTLLWERWTGGTGGGGGGGAVTIANGADVAQGNTTDAAWSGAGAGTLVAISKAEYAKLEAIRLLLASPLAVSGTFWQATQPVSGTFWQATQPVSGPLTDAQLRASPVAVSGTFWQATQPVSGPATDAQLRATPLPVSVSSITAGTNRIGAVRVVDSADADQTAIKGTQTARFLGVQRSIDSGRSQVMLSWEEVAGTANVESALTNFTIGSRAAAALGAANNLAVTAGKTLRITTVVCYVKATAAVNNVARFKIRQAAAVANTSPAIFAAVLALELGTTAAGALKQEDYVLPEGIEVAAGQQITFTWSTAANTCTVGMTIIGYEY